jgi:hypothetical protein
MGKNCTPSNKKDIVKMISEYKFNSDDNYTNLTIFNNYIIANPDIYPEHIIGRLRAYLISENDTINSTIQAEHDSRYAIQHNNKFCKYCNLYIYNTDEISLHKSTPKHWKNKYKSLQNKYNVQAKQLNITNGHLSTKNLRNKTLVTENETLETKNEILVTDKKNLITESEKLITENEKLKTRNETLKTKIETLKTRNDTLANRNDNLITANKNLKK